MSTYLDLHVLQTVPPSNLNRDDTGSPKTAVFGGVRRARVSSQAWKRAMRLAFRDLIDQAQLGDRTKKVVALVTDEITRQAPDLKREEAATMAAAVLLAAKIKTTVPKARSKDEKPGLGESGYLVFISRQQVRSLAELAITAHQSGEPIDTGEAKRRADTGHSVDIALFGRMVAEATDLSVDACAQVAHALSVHGVDNEFDYFTAVDDKAPEDNAGAGMIGTVEFNSSTLYRYATLDLDRLAAALGDEVVTRQAVRAFVEAFITTMPSGKQNTFANRTLPDAVVVQVREGQPVNLVGAFEEPVPSGEHGRLVRSAELLAQRSAELDQAFGTTPRSTWVIAVGPAREPLAEMGTAVDLSGLLTAVGGLVPSLQPA